ncbi:hypothetical protein OHC51_00465 [Stenotrophomonas indicatrix]|uniref:hypothetical protein n=1 Tax=Stenotrophomonas indicatrix TaxID=2045451 RepID=UPI00300AE291
MEIKDLIQDAGIRKVLFVDDDLRDRPALTDVDQASPPAHLVSDILRDTTDDDNEALVAVAAAHGAKTGNENELFDSLHIPEVLAEAPESIRVPYETAREKIIAAGASVRKVIEWVKDWTGSEPVVRTAPSDAVEAPGDIFDLLVIDYYLVGESPDESAPYIKKLLKLHEVEEKPLLVVLMTSNGGGVIANMQTIKKEIAVSSARFRILEKPSPAPGGGVVVIKERWAQALTQLASQRRLIIPMENFVKAWKVSLEDAARAMELRLLDLDGSAFAVLEATAKDDSMEIEEYLSDLLSRRVMAEAEERGAVLESVKALQRVMDQERDKIMPILTRGVELRDAQLGIRSLMSDVIWHRPAWWKVLGEIPAVPEREKVEPAAVAEVAEVIEGAAGKLADSDVGLSPRAGGTEVAKRLKEVMAGAREEQFDEYADHLQRAATSERLQWLKRHVRFGTVLQERRANGRYILNITQACDVQQVPLDQVKDAAYLFIRGDMAAVDVGTHGEKMVESQFFHSDRDVDSFHAFHWNLRQPFTPTISELLGGLEDYLIVGQLRYESAYRVLAKFASQATRVAEIHMPKFFRWPVHIFQVSRTKQWVLLNRGVELSSSAWHMTQKPDKGWQIQFSVEEASSAVELIPDLGVPSRADGTDEPMSEENRGRLMNALSTGITLKGVLAISGNLATAVRVVAPSGQNEAELIELLEKKISANQKSIGHVAFVLASAHK